MKNLNHLLLIGAFCGLLSEQSVIGKQLTYCISNSCEIEWKMISVKIEYKRHPLVEFTPCRLC